LPTPTPEFTRRLYHGTAVSFVSAISGGIDLYVGNPLVDFGQGFYTTNNLAQAKDRALMQGGGDGAVVVFDVPVAELNALNHKVFLSPDTEWSQFVLYHRSTPGINHPYDWVEGPVASRWNLSRGTVNVHPGYHQLSIHTVAAIALFQRSITGVIPL
jgi:hypothetical protein